jgi:hypothetical protein
MRQMHPMVVIRPNATNTPPPHANKNNLSTLRTHRKDTTQNMTNIALFLTITLLTYLTLAWLDKTGKLQNIKTYLQKYPPH